MFKLGVVGGGIAGILASLSAKSCANELSCPLDVLLIAPEIGGTVTRAKVTPLCGAYTLNGNIALTPLAKWLIEKLIRGTGGVIWEDPIGFTSRLISFPIETLNYEVLKILSRAGVKWINAKVSSLNLKGTRVTSLELVHENGAIEQLQVDALIDATGIGFIGRTLGLRPVNEPVQSAGLIMLFENVDYRTLLSWALRHQDEFYQNTRWQLLEDIGGNSWQWALSGFSGIMKEYAELRDRLIMFSYLKPDRVAVNLISVECDPLETYTWEKIQLALKKVEISLELLTSKVPGFRNAKLISVGSLTPRDSYRYNTLEVLSGSQLQREPSPNTFLIGSWPVDIHQGGRVRFGTVNPAGYPIPLGTMVSAQIDNLFFAGKTVGADNIAFSSVRVQATVGSIGEVAGIIASISLCRKVKPYTVNLIEEACHEIIELRERRLQGELESIC